MIDNAQTLKKRAWEKYGKYEDLEAERKKNLCEKIGKLHKIIESGPLNGILQYCKKEIKKIYTEIDEIDKKIIELKIKKRKGE